MISNRKSNNYFAANQIIWHKTKKEALPQRQCPSLFHNINTTN